MKANNQYIVIVGCGRLGVHLANQLSREGHSIVAIDWNEAKFAGLAPEFSGFRLEGNATELEVLKQAKTDKADMLVAVTRDDNVNLAVAQIAKVVFKVPTVVARVNDPEREAIFRELGVQTICPLLLGTRELLDRFGRTPLQEPKE